MRFLSNFVLFFVCLGSGIAFSGEVQDYAKACASAIGGDIPAFSCNAGEIITIKGNPRDDKTCDNPAHLPIGSEGPCIEGSYFQKLIPTNLRPGVSADDIEIRLLCRHYKRSSDLTSYFDDIAIIATNRKNGATCFFQSDINQDLNGNNHVAPSDENHSLFTSSGIGASGCVGCHSIRPFIETPFLASVSPAHKIRNIADFNRNAYWFPNYPDTKIYKSSVNNNCTTCHNIASDQRGGMNTSLVHQSIGMEPNPNVGLMKPFMLSPFGGSAVVANQALQPHIDCLNSSNCGIDISSEGYNNWLLNREPEPVIPDPIVPDPVVPDPVVPTPGKIDTSKYYTLVASHSNKCLDARGGSAENGTLYQQYDCNGTDAQTFRLQSVGADEFELRTVPTGRCVSSAAGKLDNGNPMVLWDCGGGSDQRIRLVPSKAGAYEVRFSNSNKCMDVQDFSNENGKDVHQWDCSGGADQSWFLREAGGKPPVTIPTPVPTPTVDKIDGKIFNVVSLGSNKCLDAKDGGIENITPFQQWDCLNNAAQKFRFKHVRDGLYSFGTVASNRCVSSAGNEPYNGVNMILWDCNYTPDQLVRLAPSFDGAYSIIFQNSSKCMAVQPSDGGNGNYIQQWDCTHGAFQQWILRETW